MHEIKNAVMAEFFFSSRPMYQNAHYEIKKMKENNANYNAPYVLAIL